MMMSHQLLCIALAACIFHQCCGNVFPESHLTMPTVFSRSSFRRLLKPNTVSDNALVLQVPLSSGRRLNGVVLHFELVASKPMSFPVYTLDQNSHGASGANTTSKPKRVLHSNRTSNCHYSASLFGHNDLVGSVSLCEDQGRSVHGVLPINSTHSGYIYPVVSKSSGPVRVHRINIYPHSLLKTDWMSLDAMYAQLAKNDHDGNAPPLTMNSMLHFLPNKLRKLLRQKRAADYTIRLDSPPKPHVVTKEGPFLMELYLIADRDFYAIYDSNVESVIAAAQNIINFVNNRFRSFDLHIAVTGLEIWKEPLPDFDFSVFADPRKTVDTVMSYASSFPIDWQFDCVHLLHGRSSYYNGKSAGMAKEATMCSRPFCVGFSIVTRDSRNSATAGIIMSHELAHNLGSGHDEEMKNCRCPAAACIMSANLFGSPLHQLPWSDCSTAAVRGFLDSGVRHCLLDPAPTGLDSRLRLQAPVIGGGGWPSKCGNGLVEPGEACDCGGEHGCAGNPCCVAATCQLASNATCATGACCDLSVCRPRPSGDICRPAKDECDFSEHCDGLRDACPADVWRLDGAACDNGANFCWSGRCPSADAACQTVWGVGSRSQGSDCYSLNVEYPDSTNILGCRFSRLSSITTVREMCHQSGPGSGQIGSSGNARCGRLMCHAPFGPPGGASAAAGLFNGLITGDYADGFGGHLGHATGQARLTGYHTPLSHAVNGAVCRAVIYDYGPLVRDPGLVPDGVGCGSALDPNRVCNSGRCLATADVLANSLDQAASLVPGRSKSSMAAAAAACSAAGGSMNSRGNCHCPPGRAPPDCRQPGAGGSIDSGPTRPGFKGYGDDGPANRSGGTIAGIVFAVLLVLILAIVSLVLLMRYRKRGAEVPSWCDLLRLQELRRRTGGVFSKSPTRSSSAATAVTNASAAAAASSRSPGTAGLGDQADRRLINGAITAQQHQKYQHQLLQQHHNALYQNPATVQLQNPQQQQHNAPTIQRPVISGAQLISSTYTDGDLTDRSTVSPQIRRPKLPPVRPPPAPPKPYSLPYGRQQQQQQQQQQIQMHSTVV